MKSIFTKIVPALLILSLPAACIVAQEGPASPAITGKGTCHGLTPALRDLPVISPEEFRAMEAEADLERNRDLENRSYPYAVSAQPTGPDPVWQKKMGDKGHVQGLLLNFHGQNSPYYPPDANGASGPLYYMQSVNTTYAIYNKSNGNLVAGPTNMNVLFGNVPGANCNDGDPLILYDEQAGRWLAVAFSICSFNDRILAAVSQTSDPTGSWYTYSFDVDDVPDYEKFGIWQDGYYMGTNNPTGKDIYVFERSQMLVGGVAQFIGFNNPWRPTTIDGFMCVPPVDNDGTFAPAGRPGLFITLSDDAIAGGSDQLWIYELDVDWANPQAATFNRVQQLNVPPFDSNFGTSWDNIDQPGTSQRLDAIPQVIMNRPQYRNFGSYETILCCHTVDVDATNHAGIRWYELRRTGGNWSIRQSGTYAPDGHSRWMGSIALNGSDQIGLAYSISSNTEYPGIRFCGQSESEYEAASGILDIEEAVIQAGANSQFSVNRWGDYADICVDPDDDHTFWFTSQYIGSGGARRTKVASFGFAPQTLTALFSASNTHPCQGGTISFLDESTGDPTSWEWSFEGGEPPASSEQNPSVTYAAPGNYDVQLIVSNGTQNDTLLLEDHIQVLSTPVVPQTPSGIADLCSGDPAAHFSIPPAPYAITYSWFITPPEAGTFTGSDTLGTLAVSEDFTGMASIRVRAENDCGLSGLSDSLAIMVQPGPTRFNMVHDGGFCQGQGGFEVTLDDSEAGVTYELFRNGTSTGLSLPGYGGILSFGQQSTPGIYTIVAYGGTCSIVMNDSTNVYYLPSVAQAAVPQGPEEVCNSEKATEFTTAGAVNAINYIWHVEPPTAGTIAGNTTTGYVSWSPEFSGTAVVKVQGTNTCGPGVLSEGWPVTVIMAPHPMISGQSSVCNTNTGNVYFYSTPDNPVNEYFWTISSGNLVTGQSTNQIIVTWAGEGEGKLTVAESSPNGCIAIADTLFVNINDCTGLEEHIERPVTLYPNPVRDELRVECRLESSGTFRLLIFNSLGQVVVSQQGTTSNGEVEMNLSTQALKPGKYSVKLLDRSGRIYGGNFVKAGS